MTVGQTPGACQLPRGRTVSALTVGRATDSPYEPPLDPELRVDTTQMSAELIVETLFGQV
jgi:hypothetical protein